MKLHPKESYSSLIQQILEREIVRPDRPSTLDLVGIVDCEPDEIDRRFVDRPEDSVMARDPNALLKLIGLVSGNAPRNVVPMDQRQPEDRFTGRDR